MGSYFRLKNQAWAVIKLSEKANPISCQFRNDFALVEF